MNRAFGPNLRLGAFAGGGASREDVELSVQSIDSTYAFGGGYGRFDWVSQYLDFSLYGGSISNSSTRGIANNTVASGFETATASPISKNAPKWNFPRSSRRHRAVRSSQPSAPAGNVSLFISAGGTAISDRSYSGAATGGARVSF